MTERRLQIHTENLLPIIKKWLYSERDIFVRELISNSTDALRKIELLHIEKEDLALEIRIEIDKERKALIFSDTGIGMSAEEVEKYIAQIAFSGAKEFVENYQKDKDSLGIIGHFGLGFYSAYMVAHEVTIDTKSYVKDTPAAFWKCDGGVSYTLEEGQRKERGTTITLFLNADSEEFLEEEHLRTILLRFCAFLPFPIFLQGKKINEQEPLWIAPSTTLTDEKYKKFYQFLYPADPEPVLWVHLNVDYPFNLKGILYFPKLHKNWDWEKTHLKLFCNRVFVSDSCKDLLPDYLTHLKGVLDSNDIPLNVSRSFLQKDKRMQQLSSHIAKKIGDKLCHLLQNNRDYFLSLWPEVEMIVKLGALQDEKFYEKVKEALLWKTSQGNYVTVEEYQKLYPGTVYYTVDAHSPLLHLYTQEVLLATSALDPSLMSSLEQRLKISFQRIDSSIENSMLDPTKEKVLLDQEGKTEAAQLAQFAQRALEDSHIQVEAKSLNSNRIPAFFTLEERSRRFRDYLHITQKESSLALPIQKNLVLNTNHPLIEKLMKLRSTHPETAKEILLHLKDLTLLMQKELDAKAVEPFVERSLRLLEQVSPALSTVEAG